MYYFIYSLLIYFVARSLIYGGSGKLALPDGDVGWCRHQQAAGERGGPAAGPEQVMGSACGAHTDGHAKVQNTLTASHRDTDNIRDARSLRSSCSQLFSSDSPFLTAQLSSIFCANF